MPLARCRAGNSAIALRSETITNQTHGARTPRSPLLTLEKRWPAGACGVKPDDVKQRREVQATDADEAARRFAITAAPQR